MTNVEVLEIALSNEEKSIELYQKLIADHPDSDLKDIFYSLLTEEQKHKSVIEKKIYELTK